MGLLDNLRKRAAEASEEPEVADPSDGADSLHGAAGMDSPADDGWLVEVERRKPDVEMATPAMDTPNDLTAGSLPTEESPVADDIGVAEPDPNVPPALPSTLQNGGTYPDLGMVYAGLEETGIAPFPSENTIDSPPAPSPLTALPSIESGPIGPEAPVHLTTLGLSVGCTWDEVTAARRQILEALTAGTTEEWNQRVEANHAFASLRLMRVGPLKY